MVGMSLIVERQAGHGAALRPEVSIAIHGESVVFESFGACAFFVSAGSNKTKESAMPLYFTIIRSAYAHRSALFPLLSEAQSVSALVARLIPLTQPRCGEGGRR